MVTVRLGGANSLLSLMKAVSPHEPTPLAATETVCWPADSGRVTVRAQFWMALPTPDGTLPVLIGSTSSPTFGTGVPSTRTWTPTSTKPPEELPSLTAPFVLTSTTPFAGTVTVWVSWLI